MKIEMLTPYTAQLTLELQSNGRVSLLLLSDVHWDNPHCRRDLLTLHLEQAAERGAGILIFGDLFCAMQGKYDPRGNKAGIRPEHNVPNYLDALVEDAAKYFAPYKERLLFVSPGNHETSILKRQETDLIARFAKLVGCEVGTYAGWVRLVLLRNKFMKAVNIAYHHGYGGGGPVTKDVIQASRKAVYLPDADVLVSGHTHDRNIFPVARVKLKQSGRQVLSEQIHCKLGTYKDEYTDGNGWAVEKGMPPKPLGGVWLHIENYRKGDAEEFKIKPELA